MERGLEQKSGIPKDLDLNDEETMDYWAASRLLKRLEAVMEQVLLASNFWDVIFKTIPEWSDMVRKCTFKTEQHVYDLKKMILSLSLYLQMVLFHFRTNTFSLGRIPGQKTCLWTQIQGHMDSHQPSG